MPPPRFYFSLRSPYSWLAYRDLVDHHPDVVDMLDWRPFWEPDEESARLLGEAGGSFPYVDMSRAKALYILQDVRRLALRRGLTIAWPVDRVPRWEVPHLAYLAARRLGSGPGFVDAAYRARWEQGRDICDVATVGAIAAELDLDPRPLKTAADDPDVRAEGTRALLAIDADGVFGVPFFVHRRDKYWGVDRLPDLVAAVRAAAPVVAMAADGATAGSGPSADEGHAGGCG